MRVLIALVALLAVASAQSCPNSTAICAKARESCTASSDPNTSIQCAWGTQCIPCTTADCKATLECFPQPRLGEACSNSGPNNLRCFDPNWDITCDGGNSGVCRYKDIYGPGEGCKPTDANYVNGGCLGGITCDPSTKKCAAVKAGQPCDTNGVKDDVCEPGTYCDTDASVCAPRKALNSPCNTNYECIPTLVCTDRKVNNAPTICQEPFVGKAGDSCEDGFDCGADLLCDNDRCTAPAADGQNCGNDVSICTDAAECECDVQRTNSRTTVNLVSGTCKNQFALDQYINSGSQINAFKSMQSCLQNNNCHDIWMSVGQLDLNSGPDQCIRKCLRSSFETPFDSNGRGYNTCRNSGSVIIPGAIALIALIAALLF